MATNDPIKEASSSPLTDINRLNQLAYGSEGNDQLATINKSLEEQIKTLEERYAQPNWYKVAAGFAKPQLGGFMASLGSASEAMGENLEQQRAMGIPLAKMRTEMAVNSAILNKNKQVSDEIQAWYKDPKNAGKLPPDQLAADWRARAPDAPAVKSLDTQIGLQQKTRQQAQENLNLSQKLNRIPTQADIAAAGLSDEMVVEQPKDKKDKVPAPLDLSKMESSKSYDFGVMPISQQKMMIPAYAENIKKEEDLARERMQKIAQFGSPENYQENSKTIDQFLNFAEGGEKNRKLINNVVNKMQMNGEFMTAFSAALNQGIHGSAFGNSVDLGLPVKTFFENLNSPEERRVAQMLMQALDNANFVNTQLKGGLKGALPVSEANVLTGGALTRDLNLTTLLHSLYQTDNSLKMFHNAYEGLQSIRKKHHDELTPYAENYQILNSDWFNNMIKDHMGKSKEISDIYNKTLVR
jgi:hypothetical protein